MKLNRNFITHTIAGKQMMVSVGNSNGFHGMVKSNESAAYMVDLLKKETTREEMIENLLKVYEITPEKAGSEVDKVLDVLRSIGALDE